MKINFLLKAITVAPDSRKQGCARYLMELLERETNM